MSSKPLGKREYQSSSISAARGGTILRLPLIDTEAQLAKQVQVGHMLKDCQLVAYLDEQYNNIRKHGTTYHRKNDLDIVRSKLFSDCDVMCQ